MSRSLDRYQVDGDVRTHLFFRYANAPYTRATIACLLMTEERLDRELGAVSERPPVRAPLVLAIACIDAMFRWCNAATARMDSGSPLDLRNDRRPPIPACQTGWLVRSAPSAMGSRQLADDVDLVACLGADLFVDARVDVTNGVAEELADRAGFLGLAYRHTAQPPTDPGLRTAVDDCIRLPAGDYDPATVAEWRTALWMDALAGRRSIVFSLDDAWSRPWFAEAAAHCGLDFARLGDVLQHFPPPADVAILVPRATGSGRTPSQAPKRVSNSSRHPFVAGSPPATGGPTGLVFSDAIRDALAGIQVQADVVSADTLANADRLSRCKLLILAGVDSASPSQREAIRRFRDAGNMLLAVGRCLSDVPRSGPGSISMDLEIAADGIERLCEYVARLRDRGTILSDGVVPISADGGPVRGLRSGSVRNEGTDGHYVYLINVTNAPLSILLRCRGRMLAGSAEELVGGRIVELARNPLVLPPYATWILRVR